MKKYLTILLACAAVFACQNKEDLTPAQEEQKKFTGDEAYIAIRLADVGSLNSKATLGDFQDADNTGYFKEGLVKSAHFYFYDADGIFVSEASAWPGGNNQDPANDNIEFKSNNVVVLKGLEHKNYPKFMVTVLNKTDNFKPGNTLAEMEKAMSGAGLKAVSNGSDAAANDNCLWNSIENSGKYENYFVMSTSSWSSADRLALDANGTVADGKVPYFATLLKETDFKTEPIANDFKTTTDVVTVYVERLAAKVTFKTSMASTKVILDGTKTEKNMYPLKITLAGNDNDLSGTEGVENVYIDLTGWALNATARNSYMSKNINPEWDNIEAGSLGFVWNDETHFRSYWAKSFNYDDTAAKYHDGATNTYNSADSSYPLHYQTFESGNFVSLTTPLYCPENTNTPAILNTKNGVTNVMLRAKVYKETGADNKIVAPMDMVRYNGVLYTNDRFINQLLTILNTKGKLNYYYCSAYNATTGDIAYAKLDKQFFELKADGAGVTAVVKDLTSWNWTESKEGIYTKVGSDYVLLDDTQRTAAVSAMDTELLSNARAGNATGFKDGDMFYTIRIKHANNGTPATNEVLEANYGVVRNHIYAINLTGIKKIGHAIFDEEVITNIGGTGGPGEPESYYVGANINVLSWKIVNQDVEL